MSSRDKGVLWITMYLDFSAHPRTLSTIGQLGCSLRDFLGSFLLLQFWLIVNRPNGVLTGLSNEQLAAAAQWLGDANAFATALRDNWTDEVDGQAIWHDWEDYGGRLISWRKRNAERKRKQREVSRAESGHLPSHTHQPPAHPDKAKGDPHYDPLNPPVMKPRRSERHNG